MRAILKQTSWLFVAQSLTRVVSFFYTIFLAKTLGVSDFGLFSAALAYYSIISSVADFGFNRFLIREVAKDRLRAPQLLADVSFLRLTLTSIFFAIFSVILYTLDPDKMRVSLILLATLAILPQAIALTLDAVFIAIQNLKFSAISLFISSLTTSFAGLALVGRGFGPMGAVAALIFGQVIYVLVLLFFLQNQGFLKLSKLKLSTLKQILIGSLPYGLIGVLGLLYFRIDTVLLSYIKGSFETGIYSVAYRFLEAVIFIPGAFASALFPVLAKLHDSNLPQVKKLYFKSLKIMGGLSLIIILGYIFILPSAVEIFLPNYLSSVKAIMIFSLSIPFMLMQVPAVSVLFSTDKYLKQVLFLSTLTVLFNIILNLIFIPLYGFIAAAWITIASEVLSFTIFFFFTKYKILDNSAR